MKIYHGTDRKNLAGIKRLGLLAGMASGRRKAVWGVRSSKIDYAVQHCCIRRRVPLKDVVVLEIDVPNAWCKRFAVDGVIYVTRDVPPERIRVHARVSLVKE